MLYAYIRIRIDTDDREIANQVIDSVADNSPQSQDVIVVPDDNTKDITVDYALQRPDGTMPYTSTLGEVFKK